MSTTFRALAVSVQIDNGFDDPFEVAGTLISADVSLGVDQDNASATVVLSAYPDDVDLRYQLYVYGRIDGGTLGDAILFNGEIVSIRSASDGRVTLTATDYLARLSYPWSKEERTYEDEDSSSVVQNLVEASGIDVSLTDIQAPSGWSVGVAAPVVLAEGDTPRELIRRLDEAEPLWKTWTRPNGAVRRRPLALSDYYEELDEGVAPVLSVEWAYELDGLVNAVKVTGATFNDVPIEELSQSASSYVPDPPQYITRTLDSYLIETPTRAQDVADALVLALNQPHSGGTVVLTLRHDIEPGMTVKLHAPNRGVDGDVYVHSVQHSISASACTTTLGVRLPAARWT